MPLSASSLDDVGDAHRAEEHVCLAGAAFEDQLGALEVFGQRLGSPAAGEIHLFPVLLLLVEAALVTRRVRIGETFGE